MVVITWLVVGMEVGRDGCACIVPPCGGSMNRPFATVISPPLFFYVAICDTSATNQSYVQRRLQQTTHVWISQPNPLS